MKKFLLSAIIVLTMAVVVSTAAAEKIYFGDTGEDKIWRCNPDGSGLEALVTTGLANPGSIVVHRTQGKMYWADWHASTSVIRRADLDGSNVEDLVTGLSGPYGVTLDVTAGKMYFTEFSAKRIRRANLDGSNVEDLITTGLSHPNGITLDVAAGKMYWTDQGFTKISRANFDGTGIEPLVTSGDAPMEIALDLSAGKMYWADLGMDSLYRANLDGTGVEAIIASEFGTPVGVDLDLAGGKIYYSDSGSGSKIKRANLDGTGVEDLVTTLIGSCYGLSLGPAVTECGTPMLDGPWIIVVSGVEPQDYAVYMTFDGLGTIDELGSFNVPDSAGTYAVDEFCDLTGYLWSDGYVPFVGAMTSDSTGNMDIGSGPMPLLKVSDPGKLQGCWEGTFEQETLLNVQLFVDANGNITSSAGFPGPVSGKLLEQSGYVAGHIYTGDLDEWNEVNIRTASLSNDTISGTFALDCDCPGGTFALVNCGVTGIGDGNTPGTSRLMGNYPNPFNPNTTIRFELAHPGRATLSVYDVSGRHVVTLADRKFPAGISDIVWNGRDARGRAVASGVYFYRLVSPGGEALTRKAVLLK